jgi:hypothetical protein
VASVSKRVLFLFAVLFSHSGVGFAVATGNNPGDKSGDKTKDDKTCAVTLRDGGALTSPSSPGKPSAKLPALTWGENRAVVTIRNGSAQESRYDGINRNHLGNSRLVEQSGVQYTQIDIIPEGLKQPDLIQQQTDLGHRQLPVVAGEADRATVLKYLEVLHEGLNQTGLNLVFQTTLSDPTLFNKALAQAKRPNPWDTKVTLSDYGLNRFFWFKPEGTDKFVPARVLVIQGSPGFQNATILIDFFSGQTFDEVLVRTVGQLRPSELGSIRETLATGEDRKSAAEFFYDSLTLDEVNTLKMARSLRLNLYGFYNFNAFQPQTQWFGTNALGEMNSFSNLAIRPEILETYGSIDDLLTPEELKAEKEAPLPLKPNLIDIFARLRPSYVFDRFGRGQEGLSTTFVWVVAEDGGLRIVPAGRVGSFLRPPLVRLASGQKIYAGGLFTIRSDGTLNITLSSKGYEGAAGDNLSYMNAYSRDPDGLEEFIKFAFARQAGRTVHSISATVVEGYSNNPPQGTFEPYEHSSAEAGPSESMPGAKIPVWDLENGSPLSLDEVAEGMGLYIRSDEVRVAWAHHVLQTDPNMTLETIKKSFRKLQKMFHPDINRGKNNAEENFKWVGNAFEILKDQRKTDY